MSELSPVYLAGEGRVILKLNCSVTMADALALLEAPVIIFNVEYPNSSRNVFIFRKMAMLEKTGDIRKRGTLNKFLQELQ